MQYAQALTTPAPKGRMSTLTSPVFEAEPAPQARGRNPAFYDDRFETAEPAPQPRGRNPAFYDERFETAEPLRESVQEAPPEIAPIEMPEDEDDDAGGAATRAVSWEDQADLLQTAAVDDFQEEPTHALEEEEEPAPPEPPARAMTDGQPRGAPTAEGSLAKTPFVHLLIYMLDQRLSGTTVFKLPNGSSHSVYFIEGTPAKVRTGGMIEPLDCVLVDLGLLDEATLRGTLMEVSKKNVLHGRLLVMKGLLTRETVVSALRAQVLRKVTHLFELPGDVRYAYYREENLLSAYGGPELTPTEPLATIMAGVRLMAGDPLVDATLSKIQGRPLSLHIDAEMKRFQLTREEQSVVDVMRTRKMTIKEIVLANVAQERVVRLMVYALVVTRHLDLGVAAKPPVGLGPRPADAVESRPEPPPAPAPAAAKPRARSSTLGGEAPAAQTPAPAAARPRARSATLGGDAPTGAPPPASGPPQYAAQRGGRNVQDAPPSSQHTPQPMSPWGAGRGGQTPQVNMPVEMDAPPASRPTTKLPRVAQPSAAPQQQYAQQPPQQQYAPPPQQQYAQQPPPQQQYAPPPQQQYAPRRSSSTRPPPQQQYAQQPPPQQQYAPPPQQQYAQQPPPQQQYAPPPQQHTRSSRRLPRRRRSARRRRARRPPRP